MDYYPVRIQVAFFLAAVDFSSKFKIAQMVREKASNLEVDPLLLPLPENSPPEFPHIVIRNENTGWTFQMASARFDVVVEREPQMPRGGLDYLTGEASNTTLAIWQGLATRFQARANRLGLITTVLAEVQDAPEALRVRYLSTAHASGAYESQLHILHKLDNEGFSVNRWVRLRAMPANDKWPSRLAVEVDVNSIAEQPLQVTENLAQKFTTVAAHLTEQTLDGYLTG